MNTGCRSGSQWFHHLSSSKIFEPYMLPDAVLRGSRPHSPPAFRARLLFPCILPHVCVQLLLTLSFLFISYLSCVVLFRCCWIQLPCLISPSGSVVFFCCCCSLFAFSGISENNMPEHWIKMLVLIQLGIWIYFILTDLVLGVFSLSEAMTSSLAICILYNPHKWCSH